MTPVPSYLRNHDAVIKAFGYWPSFHDAPVIAFHYAQEPTSEVDLTLHTWEMTPEVDARGYFKLIKHHLVRFTFGVISDTDFDQFLPNNVLFGLKFSTPAEFQAAAKFRVSLDSAMDGDLSGSFSARTGEVLEVTPCDEKGNRAEPNHSK
jgi:hypothetical protein